MGWFFLLAGAIKIVYLSPLADVISIVNFPTETSTSFCLKRFLLPAIFALHE